MLWGVHRGLCVCCWVDECHGIAVSGGLFQRFRCCILFCVPCWSLRCGCRLALCGVHRAMRCWKVGSLVYPIELLGA